ncbi:hypothetical protein JQX09_17610 [Sulfitobacter pseudonitzschiae]|uniref:Phage Mu protein F like protein n=1 Tax=Pseudosulfitobacter pseudonitzschiae TaxID=1402135 RepID=A0A9Q2RTR7_9RHOB|nr:hypothetical protein [Pseudosulfitobacter pseudonitzschiae]MBM2298667.1 hypothetical protein [Pseudosulfitobacter pseudonitzschiae]MBM2303581.1 hypothetical protein [Pseudosulfitobacter pseudonitzschiae]MBM2313364.1 hypothetical protein [Pseudosulfitobacter pseudonitzschiae]MBM2318277.1 hypothetical protein [Pseudosulfitobacter pseudonitzschiae]
MRFDGRNPRAESFLKRESSRLITDIVEDTRKAIRTVLELDMAAGRGPRATALDIVGRVNRATGRREGGLIGLTEGDMQATRNALAQLRSGQPGQMRAFMRRAGVTKREMALVQSYIRDKKPVPADIARKLVGRYSDNLLKLRGETIARTELLGSLHHAQDEGLQQLVDAGKLRNDQITEEWDASEDGDTRDSHAAVNGTKIKRGELFIVGGYQMSGPGDRSHGAPAKEIISCRCRKRISINFLADLAL